MGTSALMATIVYGRGASTSAGRHHSSSSSTNRLPHLAQPQRPLPGAPGLQQGRHPGDEGERRGNYPGARHGGEHTVGDQRPVACRWRSG